MICSLNVTMGVSQWEQNQGNNNDFLGQVHIAWGMWHAATSYVRHVHR